MPPPALSEDGIRRLAVDRVDRDRRSVGMVVGLTEAGRHRFVAHGYRDLRSKDPVNEKTLFEIGSITKLFTALLLCDMANRGEVELNQPVAELLPAGVRVPARDGRAITLRDLASHVSGLPRRPANLGPEDRPDGPYAGYSTEKLYAFLATYELTRTPGERFKYSNVGVGLLGHALVLRAGADGYGSLIRARILDPLRMDDTVIAIPFRLAANVASAHDESLDPVPYWNFDVLAAAGALRSNLSDMLRLMDAVCDPGSPIASMIGPLMTPRDQDGLELGLPIPPHPSGARSLWHGGTTRGSLSFVRCIPEWQRGVVVLSNAGIGQVVDLGLHVLDPRCDVMSYRKEVAIDPACFALLVGRYQLRPNTVIEVTSIADRLLVRFADADRPDVGLAHQPAIRVFPSSEWHFFYKNAAAQVTFEPGEHGHAARLILHQKNLADQTAERIA